MLPFENLSDEKENAYFADGIQDDVLTNLSKIGDLKVISRTSVMPYRGKTSNVREIGKALGVGAILEGSVRRIGNRVRVNVQLINADTDEHMWAEDYDRDLTDVFAIQTDLAQQIVRELQAKLSPTEKAQIERKPLKTARPISLLCRGTDLSRPEDSAQKLEKASSFMSGRPSSIQNLPLAFAHSQWAKTGSFTLRSHPARNGPKSARASRASPAIAAGPAGGAPGAWASPIITASAITRRR